MNLYHYTDATALQSMLQNSSLWLTDIRYLNDRSEYRDGETVIRRVFEARAAQIADGARTDVLGFLESTLSSSKDSYTFIGSLSRGEDLLSQWRGYCPRSGGYALEFDGSDLKNFGMPLQECVYSKEEKESLANTLFDFAHRVVVDRKGSKKLLLQAIWANIAKFKNAGFVEESEVRAVIFQREAQGSAKFRVRGSTLIPYLQVELPWKRLTAIWIGPCTDAEEAAEGLRRFLRHLARDAKHPLASCAMPAIRHSTITYRG